MSEKSREKKVILFSTRFIEKERSLFCLNNIQEPISYCLSQAYEKYFICKDLPENIIHYFNKLNFIKFFGGFTQIHDNNNIEDISQILWPIFIDKYGNIDKDDWEGFFSDLEKIDKLSELSIDESEDPPFILKIKEKIVENNEESLLSVIKDNEKTNNNKDVVLNTDFGGSVDKRTIDRRFKIYELKTDNINNINAYGVWCLGKPSNETQWYKALYEELKTQMAQKGNDFDEVKEVLFFLHDGDIGDKVPFKVNHYKATNDTFGFLDKEITLSVAIFQHSLSPIATALSNPDIDEALKSVQEAMEKGGKLAFLNELSDNVTCWHDGGDKLFAENFKSQNIYLKNEERITEEDQKSVENLRKKIKRLIDVLNHTE